MSTENRTICQLLLRNRSAMGSPVRASLMAPHTIPVMASRPLMASGAGPLNFIASAQPTFLLQTSAGSIQQTRNARCVSCSSAVRIPRNMISGSGWSKEKYFLWETGAKHPSRLSKPCYDMQALHHLTFIPLSNAVPRSANA